jgi:hypothetical protein
MVLTEQSRVTATTATIQEQDMPTTEKAESDKHFLTNAKRLERETIEMRRHLHEHPELSFHEIETAKLMNDKLESLGYKTKKGVGKTGVIGDLGKQGPLIAIRADMDGLPIDEDNKAWLCLQKPRRDACLRPRWSHGLRPHRSKNACRNRSTWPHSHGTATS